MSQPSARVSIPLAEQFQIYLERLKAGSRPFSEAVERETFNTMWALIDAETDAETKEFMHETLAHYCSEDVLLSVKREHNWDYDVREQRTAQQQAQPKDLFLALEDIVARHFSSSGYTKTFDQRRWPLTLPGYHPGHSDQKFRHPPADISHAKLFRSYYQVGVHTLRIGHAICELMNHLEERYDLDFDALENSHRRKITR